MRDTLKAMGYAETPVPDLADLVIFNTCHIREHAAEKVYSELGRMKRLKKEKGQAARCWWRWLAWPEPKGWNHPPAKTVDLVFGPQTLTACRTSRAAS
jgi:tRNA-2-methylthio-N6-dimethylallyladenosine synthase